MGSIAIDLDDAGLAIQREGDAAPVIAPSVIRATAGERAVGASAADEIRLRPREVSTRHWLQLATHESLRSSAMLARAELLARLGGAAGGSPALVAVPPHYDAEALGYALWALQGAGLAVRRLVDSAALRCAALGLERDALVLDVGLHHVAVAAVRAGDGVCRRTAVRWRGGNGAIALLEGALQLVSEAMVLRHRFDPLHDGVTEQAVYELLPAATTAAVRAGRASVVFERAGRRLEVELSRDQFAARSVPTLRELLAFAHELRPAGAAVDVVIGEWLARWPGTVEQLEELRDCPLHVLPEGFAARAAALLDPAEGGGKPASDAPVCLSRRIAVFAAPLRVPTDEPRRLGATVAQAQAPTHLLHAGRAYALRGEGPLEIGRAPDARGIALPDGMAGLSRLHCTLREEGGEVVLIDHSRYGSWVNGERVAGRVRLRAGDSLRIGDPGVEFALIAVGADAIPAPR
jgi:hypothetical protein